MTPVVETREHWDSALADTVPIRGCHCAFCGLRPLQEPKRRTRCKQNAQNTSASTQLPPKFIVHDVLYGSPASASQREFSTVSDGSSSQESCQDPGHRAISMPSPPFTSRDDADVQPPSWIDSVGGCDYVPNVLSTPPAYCPYDPGERFPSNN